MFIINISYPLIKSKSKSCSLQLQKIVSSPLDPDGGFHEEQFLRWEKEILLASELLFTPNNATFYWSMEQKYGIDIIVFDGFSHGWVYKIDPTPTVSYLSFISLSANYNTALINYPGFTYRFEVKKYYMTIPVYSRDARLITVTLIYTRPTN